MAFRGRLFQIKREQDLTELIERMPFRLYDILKFEDNSSRHFKGDREALIIDVKGKRIKTLSIDKDETIDKVNFGDKEASYEIVSPSDENYQYLLGLLKDTKVYVNIKDAIRI